VLCKKDNGRQNHGDMITTSMESKYLHAPLSSRKDWTEEELVAIRKKLGST